MHASELFCIEKVASHQTKELRPWQQKVNQIIFGTDTFWGKAFDVALLCAILLSVLAVMLESVKEINDQYYWWLKGSEWFFTILFTLEYLARVFSVTRPWRYILSWMGIIDLLSILPTYLGLFITGSESLRVIRSIRLLRIFRVLKLTRYLGEASVIVSALKASRVKITVFLGAVIILAVIMGTLLYVIEGQSNPALTSIPRGIYWAIVTLTTVGYGDISPQTPFGQAIAAIIMILGYGVIAVPTGIVTAELTRTNAEEESSAEKNDHRVCHDCGGLLGG